MNIRKSSYHASAIVASVVASLVAAVPVSAQFTPTKESLSDLYPGKAYSPFADRTFPSQVFWGDTHLHTGLPACLVRASGSMMPIASPAANKSRRRAASRRNSAARSTGL